MWSTKSVFCHEKTHACMDVCMQLRECAITRERERRTHTHVMDVLLYVDEMGGVSSNGRRHRLSSRFQSEN